MPRFQVGGQAVIEGVMIRSEDRIATAVRRQDDSILVKTNPFVPIAKRLKVSKVPILRGFIAFFEMLFVGISTLNFSAEIAASDIESEGKGEIKKPHPLLMVGTVVFALALGVGLFFLLPLWFASLLNIQRDALTFNLVAGGIRLTMFVAYVWLISLAKDFRRIFEYHGAEHKTIWVWEMDEEITVENAKRQTKLHPRCGTSFVLIVALFAIIMFAIADTIYQWQTGSAPHVLNRFLVHFSLLPIVAGCSYEILKLSGKTRNNPLTKFLIKPGLWLQLITTKEPDDKQLEVAVVAVRASLGLPQDVKIDELADA